MDGSIKVDSRSCEEAITGLLSPWVDDGLPSLASFLLPDDSLRVWTSNDMFEAFVELDAWLLLLLLLKVLIEVLGDVDVDVL